MCVPIDPANVREFDPFVVPTLGQLQRQIDQYDKDHGDEVGAAGRHVVDDLRRADIMHSQTRQGCTTRDFAGMPSTCMLSGLLRDLPRVDIASVLLNTSTARVPS